MKKILTYVALATLAAGIPGVALAEMAGFHLPATVTAETGIALFAAVVAVLIGLHDYGPSSRGYEPKVTSRSLQPATEAFTGTSSRRDVYRASVRRNPSSRPPFYPSVTL